MLPATKDTRRLNIKGTRTHEIVIHTFVRGLPQEQCAFAGNSKDIVVVPGAERVDLHCCCVYLLSTNQPGTAALPPLLDTRDAPDDFIGWTKGGHVNFRTFP